MKTRSQGFTLIELLVVIAIIGVLSAVVLASLNTARSKGNDAAIQSDLAAIQTQSEIFYGSNGNKYDSSGGTTSTCSGAGTLWSDTTIIKAVTAAQKAAGNVAAVCGSNASAYAIQVKLNSLKSGATQFWCVDASGMASTSPTLMLGGAIACP